MPDRVREFPVSAYMFGGLVKFKVADERTRNETSVSTGPYEENFLTDFALGLVP